MSHEAAYARDLEQWRKAPFIVGIQIKPTEHTACDGACKVAGYYRLEDAPSYPFKECTAEFCTCYWQCVLDDETAGIAWRT